MFSEAKILFQTVAPEKITWAHSILNETMKTSWMIILMVTTQKENREQGDGQVKLRLWAWNNLHHSPLHFLYLRKSFFSLSSYIT